ncbi:hypothetical protein [Halostella litorea]|uniref:hypothetical protein n=1 Tax=Halostella litorea TaxID=2528831 RepID=UPI001092479A|nr:hypothetical protein [Halostella litorea]
MPNKGRRRRRKRDSRGKLYDPKQKRDAGKQAHENRLQTAVRKAWWAVKGGVCMVWDALTFWR